MRRSSHSARRTCFRLFQAFSIFALGAILQAAPSVMMAATPTTPTAAPSPPAAAPPSATSPTVTQASAQRGRLDLNKLLADPVAAQAPFRVLVERREGLAQQNGDPAQFEQAARDFEKLGAWYSALEICWWADKLTDDAAKRQVYAKQMADLQEKSRKGQGAVDAALQVWAAGGPAKAVEALSQVVLTQPYNEKAHYEIGYRTYLSFTAHDAEKNGALPLETRARHFRICYEEFLIAIAIDPLLNDAYYQLNQARDILSDNPEFLQRSQSLTQRSLDFMSGVLPIVGKIEEGDRSAETFDKAGDALAGVQQYAYAIFAYQAALAHAEGKPDLAKAAAEKIARIRKEKLAAPAAH